MYCSAMVLEESRNEFPAHPLDNVGLSPGRNRRAVSQCRRSMQRAVPTLVDAVMRGHRVKLRDLRFKMFVDKQQRLQRAAQVAVATGDDLVDRRFIRSDTHPTLLIPAGHVPTVPDHASSHRMTVMCQARYAIARAHVSEKVPTVVIK